MNTSEFIALCDGIPAEERQPAQSRINPYEEERVRIKDALTPSNDEGMLFSEFQRLRTGFIYLSIIDSSKDYSCYYYILEKISEHFNGSTYKIADWNASVWKDVIAYAKSLPEYPRTNAFTNELIRIKERERAKAAVRLRAEGANVSVVDCELQIEHTGLIYAKIEQLMAEIGGENALCQLLSELEYKKEIGRYLVPHTGNQPMPTFIEPEKPYGYLFNLCLKYFKIDGSKEGIAKKWEELCELTTDLFIAVYDSQKYDIWPHIIYKPEDVVKIVHEMMLLFNLYTLPQTIVSFSLDWCRYLCKWVKRDSRCGIVLKSKIESFERIQNWVSSVSDNKTCVHIKKGKKESRLLEANKNGIESQLMIGVSDLNTNFLQPEDLNKVNSVRYPIIETNNEYVLLPKPVVMWNWYEAVFDIIRKENGVLAKDIGYAMEDFIRNKMRTHGLKWHTGEYNYNGNDGEVDILLEATHADAYIESKKKAISLQAKAGDDYYTWGDLREFVESQMQCSRLENGVRKYGPITIEDKNTGESYSYNWKEKFMPLPSNEDKEPKEKQRYVVKVSMTLKEYGPMQDKIVLTNIIKSLIGKKVNATFDATDTIHNAKDQASILDEFNKLNDALKSLTDYYKSIGDDHPAFFCRLYSMEQVYFLIREAENQDHFVRLLNGGFVTTGTENFWCEYINASRIVSAG